MENPYSPTSSLFKPRSSFDGRTFSWWFAVILIGGLVIGNYLTATATYWQTNPFMNWVFATSPLAVPSQISMLSRRMSGTHLSTAIFVSVTVMFAFAYAWLAWFSPNPYETFVLQNNFFGPYGWMQWGWLVTSGLFPISYLFQWVREHPAIRRSLAVTTLLGYSHNAVSVLSVCHGLP